MVIKQIDRDYPGGVHAQGHMLRKKDRRKEVTRIIFGKEK
jgi:hypothetical protein